MFSFTISFGTSHKTQCLETKPFFAHFMLQNAPICSSTLSYAVRERTNQLSMLLLTKLRKKILFVIILFIGTNNMEIFPLGQWGDIFCRCLAPSISDCKPNRATVNFYYNNRQKITQPLIKLLFCKYVLQYDKNKKKGRHVLRVVPATMYHRWAS